MSYLTTKEQAAVSQDAVKFPCRLASTGNVNLAGTITTMDSVPLADGDRVLLKDQTAPTENGIYEWDSGTQLLSRARDGFSYTDGTLIFIGEGATYADSQWVQTTNEPITLGVTSLNFVMNTTGVITDHGGLTGLGDNDHPQYQLTSEKGSINGYAGLDASAEITDATHGARSGGTLHAAATASVAGFLSASDKAKLNSTGVLTVTAPANVLVQTAAAGVSTEAARADHAHNVSVDVGTVSTITPDAVAAYGTATDLARTDHVHAITAAIPNSITVGALGGEGTANSFARSDHQHGSSSGTPVATALANSAGSSSSFSRSDHVHDTGAHSSRHISTGTDEIDGDQVDIDWNPSSYSPTTAPVEVTSVDHLTAHLAGIDNALAAKASTAHASTHITLGSDQIDGDQLDIDWNPTNYTPTVSPAEVTNVDHLTAHLAGIDNALATKINGAGTVTNQSLAVFNGTTGNFLTDTSIVISSGYTIGGLWRLDIPWGSNAGTTVTSSTTYATRLSPSLVPDVNVNDYIVFWSIKGKADSVPTSTPDIRIIVNATDTTGTGGTTAWEGSVPYMASTTRFANCSGALFWVNATSGSTRYALLQYRSPDGNSVTLANAFMFIIPIV